MPGVPRGKSRCSAPLGARRCAPWACEVCKALHTRPQGSESRALGVRTGPWLSRSDGEETQKSTFLGPARPNPRSTLPPGWGYSLGVAKKLSNSTEFERDYQDGEVICREGESSSEMFVIQAGRVRIFKTSHRGEVDLAMLEKGNFFGEMSVLESLPRDATAQSVGATRVLVMSSGALLVRLRRDPTFAFELLHRLSGRVRTLNARLLDALEKGKPGAAKEHAAGRAGTMMMYMPELQEGPAK
jgi:CRP/FNR family transcriptional regulator, cyclic AMP receptor protein